MSQIFRSRDEQVAEIHEATSEQVCSGRSDYPEDVYLSYLNRQMSEAEARGAAEERAKGAGRPVYQWRLTPDDNWVTAVDATELEQVRNGYPDSETRTLYPHPANVAALEARGKELEAVLSRLLETEEVTDPSKPRVLDLAYTAFMSGCCGKNPDDGGKCDWFTDTRPQIIRHIKKARAALTREGGV